MSNIFKIFAVMLIAISIILLAYEYHNKLNDSKFHAATINKIFIGKGNKLNDNYIGYIEIKKIKVKRLIKEGIDLKILDQNYIGHVLNSSGLDDEYGNVILAGHNTASVFYKLKLLNNGDTININTYQNKYIYEVIRKEEVNVKDRSFFNQRKDMKILTLITCTTDPNKRLIIIAKFCK